MTERAKGRRIPLLQQAMQDPLWALWAADAEGHWTLLTISQPDLKL